MKDSYTTIYYKDKKISGIFAATLNNDFYNEAILGATSILEESVPGRDIPYFYGISREPLEFEVTFAFSKPLDIYEIKSYTEMFYGNQTYQPLAFEREDGFMTPVYYVLVTGEPEIEYMRNDVNEFVGFFKLNFRCNAPYGFAEDEIIKGGFEEFNINLSHGSLPTNYYMMTLKHTQPDLGENQSIKVVNTTNGTSFEFKEVKQNEEIILDGRNKRISTNNTEKAIYPRWNNAIRDFMVFENTTNNIEIRLVTYDGLDNVTSDTLYDGVDFKLIYRMPRFM